MTDLLLTVIIVLYGAAFFSLWYHRKILLEFLREVPLVQSSTDLSRLKDLIASQMYAALLQMVLLSAPIALFFYGVAVQALSAIHCPVIVVPSLLIAVLGRELTTIEQRLREMPAASPELQEVVDRTMQTFRNKALPDWD